MIQSTETFFGTFYAYLTAMPTFIAMIQQLCAQVVMAGSQSSSFPVDVGVKQGCVLAPIIFSLFLVAMTLVSHRDLQPCDCVEVEYHVDGGLFYL